MQYKALFRFKPSKKMLVRFMDSENTYEQVGGCLLYTSDAADE